LDKTGFQMARRLRDSKLESREARSKLKVRGKPYFREIGRGLHIGYRKNKSGGVWTVRRYIDGAYVEERIALADDKEDANGDSILDFYQAQDAARNMRPSSKRGAYTVKGTVRDYLSHLEGRASHYDAKCRLEAYAIPAFGDTAVADLTADELRAWHRGIARQGARRRTKRGGKQVYGSVDTAEAVRGRQASANRCLSLLKAALNHAWREGKCELGAWPRVEPFKGVDVPRQRYLTVPECQRLINASQGDFRVLVQAGLQTGARYMELARLRVSDFHPDAGTVHIRKSKTGKTRHIFLTEEGQAFFASLAAGRAPSAPLLGHEWRRDEQCPLMKEACARAHIDRASFHALRHTWASLSVMNGTPLMVVAKNLGHVDTRMTEAHYGHLAPSYVADAIRAGAPRFGNPTDSKVVGIR
jgi:integrase